MCDKLQQEGCDVESILKSIGKDALSKTNTVEYAVTVSYNTQVLELIFMASHQ